MASKKKRPKKMERAPRSKRPLRIKKHPAPPRSTAKKRSSAPKNVPPSPDLLDLSRAVMAEGQGVESALGRIVRRAAEALKARRVGIWLFSEDRARLEARVLVGGKARGEALAETDSPAYFEALKKGRILAVSRVEAHAATRELAGRYHAPRRISSTLDVPLTAGRNVRGYLRVEHAGPERPWTAPERKFAQSLAALSGAVLQKHDRGLQEQAVRRSEKELRSVLDSMVDLCFTQDPELRYVEQFGGGDQVGSPLTGKTPRDLLDPETAGILENAGARSLAGEPVTCDWTEKTEAETRHFQDALAPLRNKDGKISGIVGVRRDVTAARNAQILSKKLLGFLRCVSGPLTDREAALWIARFSRQLLAHDAFELYLLEGSGRIQTVYSEDTRRDATASGKATEGPTPGALLAAELAADNRPRLIRCRDEEVSGGAPSSARELGFSYSLIFAPIRWQRRVMGYVSCRSCQPDRYGAEDLAILQEVAGLAGGVMARLKARHEVLADEELPRALPQEAAGKEPAAPEDPHPDAPGEDAGEESIGETESASLRDVPDEPDPAGPQDLESDSSLDVPVQEPAFDEPEEPTDAPSEEPELKSVDLNETLRQLEPRIAEMLGGRIDFACLLDPAIPMVLTDPGQFEQMLLAVAWEASRSIEGSGAFTLETGSSEEDDACLRSHGVRRRDPCVRVSVHYNGGGMDEALRERIFVPLDAAEGRVERTPSSMSAVYDLVGRNLGHVDVYCEPGVGTTVRFYLRSVREATGEPAAPLPGVTESASGS